MSWTIAINSRPSAIAGVAPTLDYRFAIDKTEIESVSLTDKLTFTGGNQGTYTDPTGAIQSVTTNTPRFDHDPTLLNCKGLLLEPSITNQITRSEAIGENITLPGFWVNYNLNTISRSDLSPANDFTATRFGENVVNNSHSIYISSGTAVTGGQWTGSFFVKGGLGRDWVVVGVYNDGPPVVSYFNIASSLVGSVGSGHTASIIKYPNGWNRCIVTKTLTTGTAYLTIGSALADNTSLFAGDTSKGFLAWGAQLEASSTATSYIRTTSTSVTRTVDAGTISGTGVITGTYTMIEKPAGCANVSGGNIVLNAGYTAERVMVFPKSLTAGEIASIRAVM